MNHRFCKMWPSCCPAEKLSASQEGLCCMHMAGQTAQLPSQCPEHCCSDWPAPRWCLVTCVDQLYTVQFWMHNRTLSTQLLDVFQWVAAWHGVALCITYREILYPANTKSQELCMKVTMPILYYILDIHSPTII